MSAAFNATEQKILADLDRGLDAVFGVDEAYHSYSANRAMGIAPEKLAGFFGEEPAQRFEARYRAACNEGARIADDVICQVCGARGHSEVICRERT
jgi:hypothetical protein